MEKGMMSIHKESVGFVILLVVVGCLVLTACASSNTPVPQSGGPNEGDHPSEEKEGEDSFLTSLDELSSADLQEGEKLRVVATTNIVADVIAIVGGESIELTALMPVGTDPHAYEPTTGDLRTISQAHVVFINGLGLETFLEEMLSNAGSEAAIVSLSEGIAARAFSEEDSDETDTGGDVHENHSHGSFDPHVWFDPSNVMIWVENAAQTLSTMDPANNGVYQENARTYGEKLQALDSWIGEMVSRIPQENRKLVTDHLAFGYFAERYGFEMVGAVIPVFSSAAEPSAQEIAALEESIRELGVRAIFVGTSVNPKTVQAVAEDTGIQMCTLYTGSLSEPDGPAGNYLDFMRYNVETIVNALVE
jgi:ABC-type Zn uptake system ZnuABC Zn-binding protein ZnuA